MLKPMGEIPSLKSLPPGEYVLHNQFGIGRVGQGPVTWLMVVGDRSGNCFGLFQSDAGYAKPGGTITIAAPK